MPSRIESATRTLTGEPHSFRRPCETFTIKRFSEGTVDSGMASPTVAVVRPILQAEIDPIPYGLPELETLLL